MKKTNWLAAACLTALLASCQCNEQKCCDDSKYPNAVIESIMERRSIRKYQDRAVPRETLQLLAECGVNAPNAMNKQRWQVRIVDNAAYIDGITDVYKKHNPKAAADTNIKNMFRNAPAVIFVASNGEGMTEIDCGLLGQNIMLAAQSIGLGTCCLGSAAAFMNSNADAAPYVQQLDLPEGYKLLYAIAVGYPDEHPDAKPRDLTKIKFVD